MEQVDKDINVRSKDEPKICDTCRYYNRNIPCGSTPSACKKADKFAEEFVDGIKKLKPKDEPQTCEDCRHNGVKRAYDYACDKCTDMDKFQHEDEPQTETEIAKAIVHKMIDNSVIAEDAYPDLRQRMHEAVERLDEYYPSEDERSK